MRPPAPSVSDMAADGLHPSRRDMLGWFLAGATGLLAGPVRRARAAGTPLKINMTFRSALYSDIFVGLAMGFFETEGLAVELMSSQIANPAVLLVSGTANVITGSPVVLYTVNAQGADMAAIYSPAGVYEAWLAPSTITSPKQLSGATLGVFALHDLDVIYTHRMMQKHGFSPGQYALVAAGASMQKVAAVKAGKVKAAPVYPPANFLAVKEGLNEIFDTLQLEEQVPSVYIVSTAWAARNSEAAVAFCRALNRAHAWLLDPTNESEAVRIMVEYTKLAPEAAQASYRLFFRRLGAYSRQGEWTRQQFENAATDMVKFKMLEGKPVQYERVVMSEYREKAAQSR
jgi:ABC-type nitrate/sulfonate/bicarbonate transport system substrate-binding protein